MYNKINDVEIAVMEICFSVMAIFIPKKEEVAQVENQKYRDQQEGVKHINAIDLFLGKEHIGGTG